MILPTDVCVEDVRYVLDYYRLSGRQAAALRRRHRLWRHRPGGRPPQAGCRTWSGCFRSLRGVGVDFAWSGNCAISFSRVPQMGRLGGRSYFAQGYSGHGVVGSHLSGDSRGSGGMATAARFDDFREGALNSVSPEAAASPFPIPFSDLGGMACATASARDPADRLRPWGAEDERAKKNCRRKR